MLFDFRLRPLDKIESGTRGYLSWYWLTDGHYRLKVGDEFLLNCTEEFRLHCADLHPSFESTLVDYHVVRLWEDVLELLPEILAPVPDELTEFLAAQELTLIDWNRKTHAWLQGLPETEGECPDYQIYDLATNWMSRRRLSLGYLRHSHDIWIWSHGDKVTISWDSRSQNEAGIQVWSCTEGSFSMLRHVFLEELVAFNNDFLSQMKERVDEICKAGGLPGIVIDVGHLEREQKEREAAMEKAFGVAPESLDWNEVLYACRRLAVNFE